MVKRELGCATGSGGDETDEPDHPAAVPVTDPRALRSRYHTVKTILYDEREDLTRADSKKFDSIIEQVESLHQLVRNPREQVADAEALLDIASTLMTSVRAHNKEGITASGFINCILTDFRKPSGNGSSSIYWRDIGNAVSHVFQRSPRCCTMIGPMNAEVKRRKPYQRHRRGNPTDNDTPQELGDTVEEEETETVKNVSTMFNILRKERRVRLENLVLNGNSFSQTVENVFALSFLVKDGRVEMKVNEEGHHLVSPRNAPAAKAIASGDVAYFHLIFRYDFKDWKLMKEVVGTGEELMPHRFPADISNNSQPEETPATIGTTPIRKFSRNRGLVTREQPVGTDSSISIAEDSAECDYAARAAPTRKGKRKLI
ncbi:PREDICTED: non-structural maintenance of chromosomes element 4 homolog A-like [Fragaria vesca subsp. vesca]|uniref:non-structural maintenance of chromosomes element 4 homolog A-like n=1 Tax=Fragaria vesca subsp. vesca TaxID=101020 RepID=UPI0002C36E5F|nr:PREDICTED: non-structural maintenance of chromosomes element 4 homolog A-like [Fragaria vesca subsp. vesca]